MAPCAASRRRDSSSVGWRAADRPPPCVSVRCVPPMSAPSGAPTRTPSRSIAPRSVTTFFPTCASWLGASHRWRDNRSPVLASERAKDRAGRCTSHRSAGHALIRRSGSVTRPATVEARTLRRATSPYPMPFPPGGGTPSPRPPGWRRSLGGEMGRNDSHGRDLIANGPDSLHYVFPDPREEIRQTCTPKGRCMIG